LAVCLTDYQRRHHAGILLITHNTALLDRWADRVVDLGDATEDVVSSSGGALPR
jgi:peptide/nickel transport system ATP-binding protein